MSTLKAMKTDWARARFLSRVAVTTTLAIVLAGCATKAPSPELLSVRSNYDVALADATIVEHAPVALFEAGKAVERAEAAFAVDSKPQEVSHLAGLAAKRLEIAEAEARSRKALKGIQQLKKLRDRARDEGRTRAAPVARVVPVVPVTPVARVVPVVPVTPVARVVPLVPLEPVVRGVPVARAEIASLEAPDQSRTVEASLQGVEEILGHTTVELESQTAAAQRVAELRIANEAAARKLLALESANVAAEERARDLLAANEFARLSSAQLQAVNQAAVDRTEALQLANEAAEEKIVVALSASELAEEQLRALEEANVLAEQEAMELQMAIEADERTALRQQAEAESAARRLAKTEREAVVPSIQQLAKETEIEAREREELERLREAEVSEYQRNQVVQAEELGARRALEAAAALAAINRDDLEAQDAARRAAEAEAEAAVAVASRTRAEDAAAVEAKAAARRSEIAAFEAQRRADDLAAENQRLRSANDALLAAVSAPRSAPEVSSAAPVPRNEPARGIEREIVIVTDGRAATRAPSAESKQPAMSTQLESAPSAGQMQAAELDARQKGSQQNESLASASAIQAEAQRAQARTAQLEKERAQLQEWNARLVPGGTILTLSDLFASNQAEPLPEAQASLKRLAAFLQEDPDRSVRIEGHTDSAGADSYNLELSAKRAEAVRTFLESEGVAPERIEARGAGESNPVAPNNTRTGRKQNRRVEVTILDTPVADPKATKS